MDMRSQTIAKLVRLMKRSDGWTSLFSPETGVAEAYERFNRTLAQQPRHERRRARDGLLLELAGRFVDAGAANGLTYRAMLDDLNKIEEGLNG